MTIKYFSIYISNLSLEMTEDELRKEFTVFGKVVSVNVVDDKNTGSGQQRRYAYVEMALKSEGETAIANLEGKRMGDKIINIIKALPLSNKHRIGFLDIKGNNQFNKVK